MKKKFLDSVQDADASPVETIVVSTEELLALDTGPALDKLRSFIATPADALRWFERVDIAFDGYESDPNRWFSIPAIHDYVGKLDGEFSYWLFLLSKERLGLQRIAHCLILPPTAKTTSVSNFAFKLDELLSSRWFPAMNELCERVHMSDQEIESLSYRSVTYLLSGT